MPDPITIGVCLVKGGIAIAKSAALKAALAKGVAWIAGKSIADGVVIAGGAVATIGAGSLVVDKCNSIEKAVVQMDKGIADGDPVTFGIGGLNALRAVFSIEDCIFDIQDIAPYYCGSDIIDQLDQSKITENVKVRAIQFAKSKIADEIGDYIIRQRSQKMTPQKVGDDPAYREKVQMFYEFGFPHKDGYEEIIDSAGIIYNNIVQLNYKLGLWKDINEYDHFLVYCMAGWIKENLDNANVRRTSQEEIAEDITNRIFAYLRNTGKM